MAKDRAEAASGSLVENVSKYCLPPRTVIEIYGATAMGAGAANVVPKIVPQERAALGWVTAHVK